MFEKIWRSLVRWFQKSFGLQIGSSRDRAAIATLPPLDDVDREYLFMQLLEGVAHGWQQPRAIGFFNKIRHRVRKSDWLEWLDRFGNNLLNSPAPNYELAGRMVQLAQLDCGDIGDKAGEYGSRLLNFHEEELGMELLPIVEFSSPSLEDLDDDEQFDAEPIETGYVDGYSESRNRANGEVFSELLIDPVPVPSKVDRLEAATEPVMETREITLEEFAAMLEKDPSLVAELAAQFEVETTDPQVIINAVITQMQKQNDPVSSDPSPLPPPLDPSPTTPPRSSSIDRQHPVPPPPPPRRLESKPEDKGTPPQSPDRGV